MEENNNNNNNSFEEKVKDVLNNVQDDTSTFDKKEIEDGKVLGVLSYIGVISLIVFLA